MMYAACVVPAAPVYRSNAHTHEMINQALFGEMMLVLEEEKQWSKIQTLHDGYEGWMLASQLIPVSESVAKTIVPWTLRASFNSIAIGKSFMQIPMASSLPGYHLGSGSIGTLEYKYSGSEGYVPANTTKDENFIRALALSWLNAPYLWGGRTLMGVDCSGFTQVLYKLLGISLLRDAHQQASQGRVVDFLQEVICGDLAFFDDEDGRIIHTGMLLGPSEIIHAAGKVRIDGIDNAGIIHSESGQRTHRLRIIKRYF